MNELLNVLYVQLQGAVLHLNSATIEIRLRGELIKQFPLLRLSGIVIMGQITLTPFLIQRCAEDGRSIVWLTQYGQYKARLEGKLRGNVLLSPDYSDCPSCHPA